MRARRDGIAHKELAHAVQVAIGATPTADELERITKVLRQRAMVASRRSNVSGADTESVVGDIVAVQDGSGKEPIMNAPYRRRTVEEWFDPAPATCPPPLDAPDHSGDAEPGLSDPRDYDDSDE